MGEAAPQGTALVAVMLFGWPFALAALFAFLSPQRATIAGFIVAWLFLPIAEYEIIGLPEFNKMNATALGTFLATALFDPNRLLSFRPKWIDLPVAILCISPLFSSLANGLGLYDGLSEGSRQLIRWGLPYLLGRVYFSDVRGMRELAIGIFLGGIIYVPLCLFEVRFSPQLHNIVYGYHQHGFVQTLRYGGFRPMVFLQHGLMVGMWMASATLAGLTLWLSGSLRHLYNISILPAVGVLFVTTLLCKSTFAILLLFAGISAILLIHYGRTWIALPAMIAVVVLYVALRVPGIWSGDSLVDTASGVFGAERAHSIQVRINNENLLANRANQRPIFGWGGWGRSRITDAYGRDISITDSQWIITYGVNGAVGLLAFGATVFVPILLLRRRIPPQLWSHPLVAPAAMFAVILALWMLDNTMNAMFNPIYILVVGGLAGFSPKVDVPLAMAPKPSATRRAVRVRQRTARVESA